MSNYLLISDAAKEVRVESHVLRYWEEELHLPIKRNELGHRYYTQDDVERFKQIKSMKERGLQLKAIKMILRDGRLDVLSQEVEQEKLQRELVGAVEERSSMVMEQNCMGTEQLNGMQRSRAEQRSSTKAEQLGGMQRSEAEQRSIEEERAKSLTTELADDSTECLNEERAIPQMSIDIVASRPQEAPLIGESKEDKSRRLQWLLQQLIRETLQENNQQLCQDIKESVIKELDYQFRVQEEREEERERRLDQRNEEYYKKMDELLRKKSRRAVLKAEKAENKERSEKEALEREKPEKEKSETQKKGQEGTLDTSKAVNRKNRKETPKGKITDIHSVEKRAKKKRHFIF